MECKTVTECNLALLKEGRHSDVVFIVGEEKERIPSHQFPLMARSPVFEVMFAERWKTDTEFKEISIPDVEPSTFHQFLQYIYADKFTGKVNEAVKLFYVANKYQVNPLIEQCELFMKTAIQLEDAIQIYQTARRFGLTSLEKQAGDLMAKNFSKLIDHRSFGLMDEDTLLHLLPRDDLLVDELKLFEALLRWTRVILGTETPTPSNQRKVLERIIRLVRFPQMRTQDFAMKVMPTNILSSDESVAILTYMASEATARSALGGTVGFPCHPRRPYVSECVADFYEDYIAGYNTLHPGVFTQISNHTDANEFCFEWKEQSTLNRTASIASVVLRGPDYASILLLDNQMPSWVWTTAWTVSLKLGRKINRPSSSTIALEGECTPDHFRIFGHIDYNVVIDPPFALQTGCVYVIMVSYSDPVYLPNPANMGSTLTHDFVTCTKLKTNIFEPVNKDGVSELTCGVKNYSSSFSGSHNNHVFALGHDNQYKSHCIRSVNLRVCEF